MDSLKNDLVKVIKKYRPTRKELENAMRECRRDKKIAEIIGPPVKSAPRKLPRMPSMNQIHHLLGTMEADGNLKFRLMAKLFLYTGLRNSEMVNIKITDINLIDNKIFINQGKGAKDRYAIIFEDFRDTLLMYMSTIQRNIYLFENRFGNPYSDRWVRKVFQKYCEKAKLPRIYPHLMRHAFITFLTKQGWTDEQIMLLSGHSSKKSLQIYQHLALPDVEKKFHEDMKGMGI